MKEATLIRSKDQTIQTLGGIISTSTPELGVFVARSMELPWKNNENNISCIPPGIYTCKYTRSNRMSLEKGYDVFTYEIMNVPNRAGIRIHSANYFFQLKGCCAVGDANKDINLDGNLDIIHSGDTVKRFVEYMNKEDFKLTIV